MTDSENFGSEFINLVGRTGNLGHGTVQPNLPTRFPGYVSNKSASKLGTR